MAWGQTRTLEQIRQRLTQKQISLDVDTESPYQQLVSDFHRQREMQADDRKRQRDTIAIWQEFDYRLEMFDNRGILRDIFWGGLRASKLNPVAKAIVTTCKQIQYGFQDFGRNVSNSFSRMRLDMRLNLRSAAISISRFCQALNPFAAWRRRSQEKRLFATPPAKLAEEALQSCRIVVSNSSLGPAQTPTRYNQLDQRMDSERSIEFAGHSVS